MSRKRKICVVTGTRAEYGLLRWFLTELAAHPSVDLQLVVTGAHLSAEFGFTYREIEKDGFRIDEKVEMLLSSDTPVGVTKSLGLAVIGFGETFDRLRPDILVVLGDRFEILAAAQAAMIARIPVAHIHGGETTEGLIDEAIRHGVTKMAHWHFAAAEPYRKRIIQLGEAPDRVYNFGSISLDNVRKLPRLDRSALGRELSMDLDGPIFLVTYHPVTLDERGPAGAMTALFEALDEFPAARVVFTAPNADTDGRVIAKLIREYVAQSPGKRTLVSSLGSTNYLSLAAIADAVIGNSSSGLIEVPALCRPTVNLGDRQRGRLRGESVIDCPEERAAIASAIRKACSEEFTSRLPQMTSPYGFGDASRKIAEVVATADLRGILFKKFYDVAFDA